VTKRNVQRVEFTRTAINTCSPTACFNVRQRGISHTSAPNCSLLSLFYLISLKVCISIRYAECLYGDENHFIKIV
jgi:hypothetical protein